MEYYQYLRGDICTVKIFHRISGSSYKKTLMNFSKRGEEEMRKRIVMFLVAAAITVSAIGCGCGTTNQVPEQTPADIPAVEENQTDTPLVEEETQISTDKTDADSLQAGTIGQTLAERFHVLKQETQEITAQEMADRILSHEMIQFEGASMPVEEGLLTGFGNTEVIGFKEGIMFAPMIGSIPFVGYVFTLEEGTDIDSFVRLLEENADPRWNICTEAEETIVEPSDNMVFFLMCPSQFE